MNGGGAVASALDWWVEAGVDIIVEDEARDWLAPLVPIAPIALSAEQAPQAARPETLEALRAWLLDPANLSALGPERIAPVGDPASGLMVLVDMPEPGDAAAGALLSGDVGTLFDRMMRAIGRDRATLYLASLSPARIPGGRVDPATLAEMIEMARRHVALARPKALLLMGDRPLKALLDIPNVAAARHRLHEINLHGGRVAAIATYHPRFLLQHGHCKADAWTDLRMLIEEFRR